MVRTILFDMGGTLDGDGQHWLERFLVLYRSLGIELPRETIRQAFDEAERKAGTYDEIATTDFSGMIRIHVGWQLEHLGLTNPALEARLVKEFVEPARKATKQNARLLENLSQHGFTLGVVSNGCGNVDKLCLDFGYAPFLSLIVDSRRVGLFKPDPAIFQYAAEKIGGDPRTMLMVGDSFERDIAPAKKIGMRTAWLEGETERDCPDPSVIDFRFRRLAEITDAVLAEAPTRL